MTKKLLGLLCVAMLGGPALAAADTVYDFTWSGGGGVTASGTFDVSNGNVQSVTGSVSGGGLAGPESLSLITAGAARTSVPDPGNSAPGSFTFETGGGDVYEGDTVFSPTSPYLDVDGLVMQVGSEHGGASGGALYAFNIWGNAPGNWQASLAGAGGTEGRIYTVNEGGTLTVSAVPLPASALLMLSGFAGLGLVGRRRKSTAA
jgi:hypothetical protein